MSDTRGVARLALALIWINSRACTAREFGFGHDRVMRERDPALLWIPPEATARLPPAGHPNVRDLWRKDRRRDRRDAPLQYVGDGHRRPGLYAHDEKEQVPLRCTGASQLLQIARLFRARDLSVDPLRQCVAGLGNERMRSLGR
jgi:hypothetical protein